MDEIEKRLRETSDNCFKSYEAWRKDQKNGSARESLQDAIHELRKVASRLEIELATSERNEMAQKPIPIPPHRDAKHRTSDDQRFEAPDNDQNFNTVQGHSQQRSGGTMKRRVQRREGGGGGERGNS